jgi:hypothetical protein
MESTTDLIALMVALFLTVGAFTASSMMISVWTPAPKPFIERVLLVGGDLLVDVRNPSAKPLSCTVYNAGIVLHGPSIIQPGKVATYTGPAAGRDVVADCTSGDNGSKEFSIAYQVAGVGQAGSLPNSRVSSGDGEGEQDSGTGSSNNEGGNQGGNGQGSGGQGGGPELRHFSCEVRHVGNRRMVRIHANLQAVVNQGAKPYNFTIDFGDGVVEMSIQNGSAYTTNHLYSGTGPYIARLIVTDALNRMTEALLEVPGGCRNV